MLPPKLGHSQECLALKKNNEKLSKCSKIWLKSNYTALYKKNAFAFDFGPQEVPKPENT